MTWGVIIANRASRDLRALDHETRPVIDAALDSISENPFAGDIKFLRGEGGIVIRRRVGAWRIIFEVHQDKHVVVVLYVERRGSNTY